MKEYTVIVGNIGSVHSGKSRIKANKVFAEYVLQSQSGVGRASGESVTMLYADDIVKEYLGTINQSAE